MVHLFPRRRQGTLRTALRAQPCSLLACTASRRPQHRQAPYDYQPLVAIEHTLLTAIWHMLTTDVGYTDLGGEYYTRRNPDRTKQRALAQLRQLGYEVTLNQLPVAG